MKEHILFEDVYINYYPKLVRFSTQYVLSQHDAENVVQDCFIYIWEQRDELDKINNLNAFLFRLVKNKCVDFLRRKILDETKKQDIQDNYLREFQYKLLSIEAFDDLSLSDDIDKIIYDAISTLPEKCKEIFILSKIEGLKYEEIAERLKISPHTVRNQVSNAMDKIRKLLKNDYALFIFMINYFF